MHGLNTINQLNGLADNNAPGAPEAAIEAADAKREGLPSGVQAALQEQVILRAQTRSNTIVRLTDLPTGALLSLASGELNTPLECALAAQLRYYAGKSAVATGGDVPISPTIANLDNTPHNSSSKYPHYEGDGGSASDPAADPVAEG